MAETTNPEQQPPADNDPTLLMTGAKDFFGEQFGLDITETGQLNTEPTTEQLDQLAEWHKETNDTEGMNMPDPETFYKKVFLAQALLPQRNEAGEIQYVFGKGAGVEMALQGEVAGREKAPGSVPYRCHSDFEIYGAPEDNYGSLEGGQRFMHVFGAQEIFPRTFTKGLRGLKGDELITTAEAVNLGGLELIVPNLELMFVDKFEKGSSFENKSRGKTDAELLVDAYKLDPELVHEALEDFVIKPGKELQMEPTEEFDRAKNLAIRNLGLAIKHMKSENPDVSEKGIARELREGLFNMQVRRYGVTAEDLLGTDRQEIDEAGFEKLKSAIEATFVAVREELDNKHQEVDAILHT